MSFSTYYHTACHTRWSQLLWRARYTLERRRNVRARRLRRWQWAGSQAPRRRADFPAIPVDHLPATRGAEGLTLLEAGTFQHLNEARVLGRQRPDWRLGPIRAGRLWTITLHYHAWAYALAEVAAAGEE